MIPIRDRLPRRRAPVVNYLLILANVAAFGWERAVLMLGYRPEQAWGLVPGHLLAHPLEEVSTVFTSMFLHDPTSYWHIGANMLFLWVFGDNVEDALGHGRYLAFYLLSGVAAAGAQILVDPTSTVPMVGASGAIAGVLAAYVSLYPRAPVVVINPVFLLWFFFGILVKLPAWVIIAEFFVVNLLSAFGAFAHVGHATHVASGGVAFFAHLGGFVAGLFLVRVFLDRRRGRDHDPWQGFRPRPSSRMGRPPPRVHRPWDG